MACLSAIRTEPLGISENIFDASIVEILQAQATVVLAALNLKLLFVSLATLLVFDKLFEHKAIHLLLLMTLSIVDFDAIDLS